jgi:hypothetical protein
LADSYDEFTWVKKITELYNFEKLGFEFSTGQLVPHRAKDFLRFNNEDPEILKVEEITFGVFRINSEYLKKMKKMRPESKLLYYPYKRIGKIDTYSSDVENKIKDYIFKEINQFLPIEKIFY